MAKHDQRGQLDIYELAVLRGGATDFDPYGEGSDAGGEDGHPPPLKPLRVGKLKVGSLGLLGGFFVLVLLVSLNNLGNGAGEQLPANCTSYGLKLPTAAVREHAPVSWSAAGPDGEVVLALDAASLRPDLSAVPLPGRTAQVIRPALRLSGCAGSAVFGVQVPAGTHTATLFRLTPSGPVAAVSAPLLVKVSDGGPAPIGG